MPSDSQSLFLKTISQNQTLVLKKVRQACLKAKRDEKEITLIYVTKYLNDNDFSLLLTNKNQLSIRDIGENRVLSLFNRLSLDSEHSLNWHFIGHLQSNKISKFSKIALIHSVDSPKLLGQLDTYYQHYFSSQKEKSVQEVLIQLNITQELNKQGLTIPEAEELFSQSLNLKAIHISGLMTMAQESKDPEDSRSVFQKLKELQNRWKRFQKPYVDLKYLSMGMSQDFEVAIEEGATHIRLGSILFSPQQQN